MRRFHVHASVEDLEANVKLLLHRIRPAAAVRKDDYAKWMLDDPRLNFAISRRGAHTGLDHLGVQVDTSEELAALREQVQAAEIAALDQAGAQCYYAKSDKYWITDPQGIAWETFHSLDSIPVYGADTQKQAAEPAAACCAPAPAKVAVTIPVKAAGAKCC